MAGKANSLAKLFQLNDELVQVLDRVTKETRLSLDTDQKRLMAVFLTEAYKTHQAIVLLAQNGFGEDAAILARSQLNLLINARWINQDFEKWVPAYLDYDDVLKAKLNRKIVESPDLLRPYEYRLLEFQNQQQELDLLAKEAKERHAYNRHGWSGKSIRDMAKDLGMLNDYDSGYVLISELEHTSVGALNEYAKLTPDGTFNISGTSSLNWVKESLGLACLLLIVLGKTADEVLELGIMAELNDLDAKVLRLHGARRSSNASV